MSVPHREVSDSPADDREQYHVSKQGNCKEFSEENSAAGCSCDCLDRHLWVST